MKRLVLGLFMLSLFACKTADKTITTSESKNKNVTEENDEAVAPEPNTRGINTKSVAPPQSLSSPSNNTSNPNTGAKPK